MLLDVLFILCPLILGYALRLSSPRLLAQINTSLGYLIYTILFLMGMSLAWVDSIHTLFAQIIQQSVGLWGCLTVANIAALYFLDKRLRSKHYEPETGQATGLRMLWGSCQVALVLAAGILVGWFVVPADSLPLELVSQLALMLMLFLIGIQLRSAGMGWKDIIANLWGVYIAVVMCLSSWVGALVAAYGFDLPWHQTVAMSSTFGWYSLSSILVTDALGPTLGAVAFINDLLRELVAFLIIPWLMRYTPSAAIGYGGATALDFTLPVIQKSGGMQVVPVAIVAGFILNIVGPVAMIFFLSFSL